MAFDLGDYVEVKDRIRAFKEAYPDGRLTSHIVQTGFEGFVTVQAYAYRTPDDPVPGSGLAWEPVPGQTPYTKNSELQNAETSAWGRALVAALIADASGGVASADEVRNRVGGSQPSPTSSGHKSDPPIGSAGSYRCPDCGKANVFDNRLDNLERDKPWPAFKCRNQETCKWFSWDEHHFDAPPIREEYEPVVYPPGQEPFPDVVPPDVENE